MLTRKTYIIASGIVLVGALFTSIVQTAPALQKRGFSGQGTYYSAGLGACGTMSNDGSLIAALNKPQWGDPANPNQNPICGKQAIVHGPKGSVTVTIVDLCPECPFGNLDFSKAAFDAIGDEAQGRIPITWEWADGGGPAPPAPPPPPPPPSSKPPPPPTSTPPIKLVSTATPTPTTKSSTTSSTTSATASATPHKVGSVSFPFMNGHAPFVDPGVTLWDGSNPFYQSQFYLSGDYSKNPIATNT